MAKGSFAAGAVIGVVTGISISMMSGQPVAYPPACPACPACPHPHAVPLALVPTAAAPAKLLPLGKPLPMFPVGAEGGACLAEAAAPGYCVHGTPSILTANAINEGNRPPNTDMCSWWGDISWHRGWIPDKRRGTSQGMVPPRALCNLPRLCVSGIKAMCLGYKHPDVTGAGRIQYCPHHDGPYYLNHSVCPEEVGCAKTWPAKCDVVPALSGAAAAARIGHPGAGRTFVFTKLNLARPANTWHWMTTMLEVFGAIVQADPGLIDPATLRFTPTSARLAYMFMGNRGWNDGSSFERIDTKWWTANQGPKVKENLAVLQSFSACEAQYIQPEEKQCFTNAVVGTSTEVMLQWEDQPQSPKMVGYAQAFATHIIEALLPLPDAARANAPGEIPHPWNRVYDAHKARPVMVIFKRGEPDDEQNAQSVGKREMTNMYRLVDAAKAYGFEVRQYFPNDGTTLKEQVEVVAAADVLIGVHGAGLGWAMILPPHAVFIELRPAMDLTDRTFVYPNVAGLRDLSFIEWHQTEPVTPAKDQRLPLDTHFTVTEETAKYYASVAMKKLVKKAWWYATPAAWHEKP